MSVLIIITVLRLFSLHINDVFVVKLPKPFPVEKKRFFLLSRFGCTGHRGYCHPTVLRSPSSRYGQVIHFMRSDEKSSETPEQIDLDVELL